MRLLLVENDPVFASVVIGEFLAAHDVTVVSTTEAATRIASNVIDAVLVDYDLDDGKGTAVVRALRGRGFRGRVIAISSHQDGNSKLLAAGADDVCSKMDFADIDRHLRGTPRSSR